MKLEPGYYKIRRRLYNEGRTKRANHNQLHILRVVGIGEQQKIFINNDILGSLNNDVFKNLDDYEIVSKYSREPEISNCIMTLSFTDSSGDHFSFSVRDAWALRNMFNEMTWLRQPFDYVPRKGKPHLFK